MFFIYKLLKSDIWIIELNLCKHSNLNFLLRYFLCNSLKSRELGNWWFYKITLSKKALDYGMRHLRIVPRVGQEINTHIDL